MSKVMLVEDDNNLREIYQARLAAEGYEIATAKDGEEALALAVKEKPDLIVCDVMMPKVSGFEMLDILRSTSGIKDTKVIMMTALSQAEDKARAEKLGADRYLVKSQVTLEDMAKTVKDVLDGISKIAAQQSADQVLSTAANSLGQATTVKTDSPRNISAALDGKSQTPVVNIAVTDDNIDDETTDSVEIARKKVIQPINDLSKPQTDLNRLLAKEEAKELLEVQAKEAEAKKKEEGDDDKDKTSEDTPKADDPSLKISDSIVLEDEVPQPESEVKPSGGTQIKVDDPNNIAL